MDVSRLRITADKREIKDFPKSRQVGTSFFRRTLGEMLTTGATYKEQKTNI
jgi:hypothetical protein